MHHLTDRMAFGTPVVEHWLEREIALKYKVNIMTYIMGYPILQYQLLYPLSLSLKTQNKGKKNPEAVVLL